MDNCLSPRLSPTRLALCFLLSQVIVTHQSWFTCRFIRFVLLSMSYYFLSFVLYYLLSDGFLFFLIQHSSLSSYFIYLKELPHLSLSRFCFYGYIICIVHSSFLRLNSPIILSSPNLQHVLSCLDDVWDIFLDLKLDGKIASHNTKHPLSQCFLHFSQLTLFIKEIVRSGF